MVIGIAPVRGRRRAGPTSHRRALLAYLVLFAGAVAVAGLDRTLGWLVPALAVLVLPFVLRSLAFAISAARWAERDLDSPVVGTESFTPSVAVLVVCRDDEAVVDSMVTGLLALDYPAAALTVVLVDDASTDGTGARLDAWAHADDRIRVLHRAADSGGGRAGALNDGLTMVDADVAVVIDVDHRPRPRMLRRLVRHFRNPRVGAVLGRCVPPPDAERTDIESPGHLIDG
ncbi:MAG TPA: glycosyltransferase, partial [Actinoplanes sp.]|nr:glycosyltransferase [Actinoplanes sp.]